jgi:hypothetical protein
MTEAAERILGGHNAQNHPDHQGRKRHQIIAKPPPKKHAEHRHQKE